MLKTPSELAAELAARIKLRRLALGWRQDDTARRAGIALRTWQRLESSGQASIEDLIRASTALRCEGALDGLFPEPAARTLDELLERERLGSSARSPQRLRAPRAPSS